MKLDEYARHDGLGLAQLVASGQVSATELAQTAAQEHWLLQLGTALEQALPWAGRVPPLHVSHHA